MGLGLLPGICLSALRRGEAAPADVDPFYRQGPNYPMALPSMTRWRALRWAAIRRSREFAATSESVPRVRVGKRVVGRGHSNRDFSVSAKILQDSGGKRHDG